MTGVRRPRRRLLRPEELELWLHVLRDVKPMPGNEQAVELAAPPPPIPAEQPPKTPAVQATPAAIPQKPRSSLPPLAPLERRLRQKLSRGQRDVDAALDLHGLRQDEAHAMLRHFLYGAHSDGARLVLIRLSSTRSAFCVGTCRTGWGRLNFAGSSCQSRRRRLPMEGPARFMCGFGAPTESAVDGPDGCARP